jgi:hypothetical protein
MDNDEGTHVVIDKFGSSWHKWAAANCLRQHASSEPARRNTVAAAVEFETICKLIEVVRCAFCRRGMDDPSKLPM